VLEEFFGIMVKLTKDAMTPGSIAGEIYERGEIPKKRTSRRWRRSWTARAGDQADQSPSKML